MSEPAASSRPFGSFRVLHVCTGNICRSPMAERLMSAELVARFGPGVDVEVRSAGTYGGHAGQPMQPPAVAVLAERGLDGGAHRAVWLREPQVAWADLVLTATAAQRGEVLQLDPGALRRTFGLLELGRLADRVPPDGLPAGSPGDRLRALVALAPGLRGEYPAATRTADDVDDPYGDPIEVYRDTAARLADAVGRVCRVLGPV